MSYKLFTFTVVRFHPELYSVHTVPCSLCMVQRAWSIFCKVCIDIVLTYSLRSSVESVSVYGNVQERISQCMDFMYLLRKELVDGFISAISLQPVLCRNFHGPFLHCDILPSLSFQSYIHLSGTFSIASLSLRQASRLVTLSPVDLVGVSMQAAANVRIRPRQRLFLSISLVLLLRCPWKFLTHVSTWNISSSVS